MGDDMFNGGPGDVNMSTENDENVPRPFVSCL